MIRIPGSLHVISIVGLTYVSGIPSASKADAVSDARTKIAALYAQEAGASMNKDVKAMFADLAPDFVYIDHKGNKVTLAQIKERINGLLPAMSNIVHKSTITEFTMKGNTATVNLRETMTANVDFSKLPNAPPGTKASRLDIVETSKDVWVKTGGAWKKKSSKTLTSQQKRDGKIVRD